MRKNPLYVRHQITLTGCLYVITVYNLVTTVWGESRDCEIHFKGLFSRCMTYILTTKFNSCWMDWTLNGCNVMDTQTLLTHCFVNNAYGHQQEFFLFKAPMYVSAYMDADFDYNQLKTILSLLKLDDKHLNLYAYSTLSHPPTQVIPECRLTSR